MGGSVRNYVLLFLLALIWGSSFILMKRGLEVYSFIELANLRMCIAFFSLTPFIPKAIRSVKRKHYLPLLITAVFGNLLPAFLFAKAQTQIDSGLVGTLNALVPLFTLILGVYFFSLRPSKANVFGILLGLLGALILAFSTLRQGAVFNVYILLVVVATIFYAISINVIKKYLDDLNPFYITTLAFIIISPFPIIWLFNSTFFYHLQIHPDGFKALSYIAVLAVFGTSIATIVFNKLLSCSSAIFASSITYLIPIVAIFWAILDGEIITFYHLLGFVIILIGVYLVNKRKPL
tara:strand:+ start:967 stop:1842 length:876 start_codon:yes stop_codon:yes gene_type:complete